KVHQIYPATSTVHNSKGEELITASAVHRPDGLWSVLLINKDPKRAYETRLLFRNATGAVGGFDGQLEMFQFSSKQYLLGGPKDNPYPVRADDPEHKVIRPSPGLTPISLPAYSLT